jgi:MoaA/NifB/PqqE/SkfB family radical SAM enzyme
VLVGGIPDHWFGSIDVTYKCNLRCTHCYFFAQETTSENLSVEQWVAKLEALKTEGRPLVQCSWIGGEPLLRPDVIDAGRRFFKSNVVVTNATMPLPDWPDVTFYVSVDGTHQHHDKIRGQGTYELTKTYACRPDLNVYICCVITRDNQDCIEEMVDEWSDLPVRGMVFDFYTPMEGAIDDQWLPPAERDQVVERLLKLKERVGGFIAPPAEAYEAMLSHRSRTVTDNCPYSAKCFSFDSTGAPKGKCMMGDEADCSRCGCVVPYFLWAIQDKATIGKMLWRSLKGKAASFLGPGNNNHKRPGPAQEELVRHITTVESCD